MRTVSVIFLVLLCTAASVRIDGVWPPAALTDRVETVLQQISEPAKALNRFFGERRLPLFKPGGQAFFDGPEATPRAVLATNRSVETDRTSCS